MDIEVDVAARQDRRSGEWTPELDVSANYHLEQRGGLSYVVRRGDSLAGIAEGVYGNVIYAQNIIDANQRVLGRSPRCLPVCLPLTLPQLNVAASPPRTANSSNRSANVTAAPVAYPTFEWDFSNSQTIRKIVPLPNATLEVELTLTGSLKIQKPGTIAGSVNLRTMRASISREINQFTAGLQIDAMGGRSLSISTPSANGSWTARYSLSNSGGLSVSIAPRSIEFSAGGFRFKGNVGLGLTLRIIPNPRRQRQPVRSRDWTDWVIENQSTLENIAIGAGIVGGAAALALLCIVACPVLVAGGAAVFGTGAGATATAGAGAMLIAAGVVTQ